MKEEVAVFSTFLESTNSSLSSGISSRRITTNSYEIKPPVSKVIIFSTLEGFVSTGYILNGPENRKEEQQQVTVKSCEERMVVY